MSKIYFAAILLSINCQIIFSQSGWFWQAPSPQGNDLNSIEITPDGTLFSAGYAGTIINSSDGAVTWDVKNNINQYTGWFHKIVFLDNNTGWAVGQNWNIHYTTDKGANWIRKYVSTDAILLDLFFLNKDTAWASGTNGTILKTTNSWSSYTVQSYSPASSNHFKSIIFINNNTGYSVGSINGLTGIVIYRSTNGGTTWHEISSPAKGSLEHIVSLPDNTLIAVTIEGEIIRSTDNGINWSVNQINSEYSFKESHFINSQTGWIVGYSINSGLIYKTTNNGVNWVQQQSNTARRLYSVKFKDTNTGYAVGDRGVIIKTTNGGVNWNTKTNFLVGQEENQRYVVKFVNENTGYSMGYYGVIAKSTNGGVNWFQQQSNTTKHITKALFINDTIIYAYGIQGLLLKTSNGGDIWESLPSPKPTDIRSLHFPNETVGYILYNSDDKIFKTTDGGTTWRAPINRTGLGSGHDLHFINSLTGIVVGNLGVINKTTNGGLNWSIYTHSPSILWKDIFFLNDNTGWVCGEQGTILKTTNQGENWVSIFTAGGNPYNKITFVDENYGWVVGYYGNIRRTTNGGLDWHRVLSGAYSWLEDVCFINRDKGWITGFGDILKTTNGGGFTSATVLSELAPKEFTLLQNYPNPFNPITKIRFDISENTIANLIVYDLLGRKVATLVNDKLNPGSYEVNWDGTGYASGVYFYSLITEGFTQTKRMVLVK